MTDNGTVLSMPAPFLWGAATAAHQNEGDNHNNQWAAWEQEEGRIVNGHRCGRANRWWDLEEAAADFDRAADLGLNSLRLSIEWSRVEPEPGVFDAGALRKYAAMIDLLRQRGLVPMVTLHHFTDPLWLTRLGAWENPQVTDWFVRYTARVVEALGDQVHLWCTINEPLVYAYAGYLEGGFPPGVKSLPARLQCPAPDALDTRAGVSCDPYPAERCSGGPGPQFAGYVARQSRQRAPTGKLRPRWTRLAIPSLWKLPSTDA